MQTTEKPLHIVVPTNDALNRLVKACSDSGIVEVEIVLARAIDCIIHEKYITDEVELLVNALHDLSDDICQASVSSKDAVSFESRKEITDSLCSLIENVTAAVRNGALFDSSFFHYEFARIGDDDNIILQRVR